MQGIEKLASLLLNFILGILCFSHIIILIYSEFHPNLPLIEIVEKDFNEIEFPLSFRLCVFDKENHDDKYKRFGYYKDNRFFTGQNMFNRSIVGWGGHTKNGSTLASVKGDKSIKNRTNVAN